MADDPFDDVLRNAFAAAPSTGTSLESIVERGSARRRRRLALRSAALAFVVVVVAAVVAIQVNGGRESGVVVSPDPDGTSAAVGPFVPDLNDPTKADTHWHAALGVYDCDHWLGDGSGPGLWSWPTTTPQGAPARAADPNVYAGLHSHGDGIIHMEPATPEDAGNNATVGRYFEYGGWKVSATGFDFLGTAVKNGDKCGKGTGSVQWEVATWNGRMTANVNQKYVVQTGDPAQHKLLNFEVIVIAFLPETASIAAIGDPPSLQMLGNEMGPQPELPTTVP